MKTLNTSRAMSSSSSSDELSSAMTTICDSSHGATSPPRAADELPAPVGAAATGARINGGAFSRSCDVDVSVASRATPMGLRGGGGGWVLLADRAVGLALKSSTTSSSSVRSIGDELGADVTVADLTLTLKSSGWSSVSSVEAATTSDQNV